MTMSPWGAAVVAALASGIGTGLVRRFAIARSILDVPNARSSHSIPTPRGGGLAIAAVVLVGLALAALAGAIERRLAIALVGGGIAVAAVGWLDDRRGVGPGARAAVHFLAAGWAVGWLGGMPSLTVGTGALPLGAPGSLLAVLWIVWLINLYNFMDGIDGIAGGEAVVVGGASLGFLVWNLPPARIFMGDVGSGLLGFLFGSLAIGAERSGTLPAVLWVLLLAVFVVDATVTLARRVANGERWYEAHRSHAYQRAVQSGLSHRAVSASVAGLSAVLAVGAAVAARRPALLPAVVAGGGALLAAVYLWVERRKPMYPRSRQG